MEKPKDYDEVQAFGEFQPLKLGGHICKIMKVEETVSQSGKPMLKISLDIAEGKQKDYYADQYHSDTRSQKRWGCVVNQLVYDNDGDTSRGFKTFVSCVEKSNSGFRVVWGNGFSGCFKNKLVGGVFGREEYLNQNNEKKFAIKCRYFRSTEAIRQGVEIPQDKFLDDTVRYRRKPNLDITRDDDFEAIEDDDDLPFEI